MEENMVENMDIEEQAEKKATKEKVLGALGNVKVSGNLVITRMTDGRSIIETPEEIDSKNAVYSQRTKECVERFKKENERREKANQGK